MNIGLVARSKLIPYRDISCKHNQEKLKLVVNNIESDHVIRIAPHQRESWVNVELLRLKLYCEHNNIKVIAYGNLNQLPLLAMVADEVMFQTEPVAMHQLYKVASHNSNIIYNAETLDDYVEVVKAADPFFSKCLSITDDDLVDRFWDSQVLIHEETYNLFKELISSGKMTSDLVVAEIKNGFGYMRAYQLSWLEKEMSALGCPLTGLNKKFQHKLIRKVGLHYMGLQILNSWLNGWVFLSGAGSGNLFCIIPVKYMTYFEQTITEHTEYIVRNISKKRFGILGEKWPIMAKCKPKQLPDYFKQVSIPDLVEAIKLIRRANTISSISEFNLYGE